MKIIIILAILLFLLIVIKRKKNKKQQMNSNNTSINSTVKSNDSEADMSNDELEEFFYQNKKKRQEKYIVFLAEKENNNLNIFGYTDELDNMIKSSETLHSRGVFGGLCNYIESLILKMYDLDMFDDETIDRCYELCELIMDQYPNEHGAEQIWQIYTADIRQCEMYGVLKKEDDYTKHNYIMKDYTKTIIGFLTNAFVSDNLDMPYYMNRCLNSLAAQTYLDEQGNRDPWWSIYWNYMKYYLHKNEERFYDVAQSAFEDYQHTLKLYNLELTDEMKKDWENTIPFSDENGECTIHPYLYD